MITIEDTNLKEESCKFLLPCGMCEFTKNKCTRWDTITGDKYTIPPAWYQPTPINTKKWEVGDWPPGPSITCDDRVPLDIMRSSDTFKVHPESDPKYNSINGNYSTITSDMYKTNYTVSAEAYEK